MLKIDRNGRTLKHLEQQNTPQAGLKEVEDIQRMIINSPDDFFSEMGEELFLIGNEVRPSEVVGDQIDLLAIDQQGATVIIELKRGSDKLQLLQALSYVSMVADWTRDELIAARREFKKCKLEDAEEDVEQFLREDISELNESQRVVLVADAFDYEVLVTAQWLTESYGVDIRCYRLVMAVDGTSEFMSCTCIYPPPEITQYAIRRGRKTGGESEKWATWEEAIDATENPAVRNFFESELSIEEGDYRPEDYRPQGDLYYRVAGKRRFCVSLRRKYAYVWQESRFDSDEDFWREKLTEPDIQPVRDDKSLRFYLKTDSDFRQFKKAVTSELGTVNFGQESEPDTGGQTQ